MDLYLVRHGQTDWNLQRRFQSRSDIPLNAEGRRQAHAIRSEFLKRGIRFTRAVSSPLGRAVETANVLVAETGVDVEVCEELVEIDLGQFEGCLEEDLKEKYGAQYDSWRAQMYLEPAPGGESVRDVADRAAPLMDRLMTDHAGETVLLVGHQGLNMAVKAWISGCFSADCLLDYKQDNDEVDIWCAERRIRREKWRLSDRDI